MNIFNQTNGNEKDMLSLDEIIGGVYTVGVGRPKFIIHATQRETLEKNRSSGLSRFVRIAMRRNTAVLKQENNRR